MLCAARQLRPTKTSNRVQKNLSVFLDFLRWISALAVLGGHLRAFLFVPFPKLESPGVLLKAFYWVTGFGHQAVIVFFVLSGFLVGGGVVNKVRDRTFAWTSYMVNRVSRLYPVLVVALLAGWGLDYWGWHLLNSAGLYTVSGPEAVIGVINYDASQRLGLIPFLANLFMLQGIAAAPFGTNGPLWSLSMEFWYYLLFPAAVLCLGTRTWKELFRWHTLLLVGLMGFLPLEYLAYFVIWLIGVVAARIRIPLRRALPWAIVLMAALLNSRAGFGSDYLRSLLIGFACALLICAVKNGNGFPLAFARIHERLSGFSYSLYLFHFPLLIFSLSVLAKLGLWRKADGLGGSFTLFGVLLLLCLGICYGLSRLTEAKTPEIRKFLFFCLTDNRRAAVSLGPDRGAS